MIERVRLLHIFWERKKKEKALRIYPLPYPPLFFLSVSTYFYFMSIWGNPSMFWRRGRWGKENQSSGYPISCTKRAKPHGRS